MDILDKIDRFQDELSISESGMRGMKELARQFKEAEIYFHQDLDGVASGVGLKEYLKQFGIVTKDVHMINYGGLEYSVKKPLKGRMAVLVDFAHGKPMMMVHTDHHEGQVGVSDKASTSFVHTPSNAAYITSNISPRDIFPPRDIEIINTVDSADFLKHNLSPDDIMRSAFKLDNKMSVEKNRQAMGLVANKLILSYKNKKGFLDEFVMMAKPSLVSFYNTAMILAKKHGYDPGSVLTGKGDAYVKGQKGKIIDGGLNAVLTLKNGQATMVGTTIVQQGGGVMTKGGYDRYTPFKLQPHADYFTIIWPMGLMQLSKNPFKGKNRYHLGDIVMKKVMPKFKSVISKKEVTLYDIKRVFEMDISKKKIQDAVGFTFDDFVALFGKLAKGLPDKGSWKELIKDISNKQMQHLSYKQKQILKKVTVNAWDIIMSQSGGHKDITNLSGFNFLGKGYTDLMRKVQYEIAKQMKDKHLD